MYSCFVCYSWTKIVIVSIEDCADCVEGSTTRWEIKNTSWKTKAEVGRCFKIRSLKQLSERVMLETVQFRWKKFRLKGYNRMFSDLLQVDDSLILQQVNVQVRQDRQRIWYIIVINFQNHFFTVICMPHTKFGTHIRKCLQWLVLPLFLTCNLSALSGMLLLISLSC